MDQINRLVGWICDANVYCVTHRRTSRGVLGPSPWSPDRCRFGRRMVGHGPNCKWKKQQINIHEHWSQHTSPIVIIFIFISIVERCIDPIQTKIPIKFGRDGWILPVNWTTPGYFCLPQSRARRAEKNKKEKKYRKYSAFGHQSPKIPQNPLSSLHISYIPENTVCGGSNEGHVQNWYWSPIAGKIIIIS